MFRQTRFHFPTQFPLLNDRVLKYTFDLKAIGTNLNEKQILVESFAQHGSERRYLLEI